jgi:KipI family sensor histidine kinase inhibitor
MPGFVYLSGLHPSLAWPRMASPRAAIPAGSVIIGGAQTGVMPVSSPSGWHCIGHTSLALFDLGQDDPALMQPGDTLKFEIVDVRA